MKITKIMKLGGATLFASLLTSHAATLSQYDFTSSLVASTSDANVTNSAVSSPGLATTITSGAISADDATLRNGLNANMTGAHDTDMDYWVFTATASSGFELDLDALTFSIVQGGDGSESVTDYAIRTSVDAFAADLVFASGGISTTTANANINLTGAAFQGLSSITFHITLDNRNGNAAGVNSAVFLDDLTLTGDSTPIPEPSSLALFGLGGIALILRRRK